MRPRPASIDFQGPMGTYLREIFFHIPFLIANHLNSQGRYEDAQRWYHYVFDPTARDDRRPPRTRRRSCRRRDRIWRYREFRGLAAANRCGRSSPTKLPSSSTSATRSTRTRSPA